MKKKYLILGAFLIVLLGLAGTIGYLLFNKFSADEIITQSNGTMDRTFSIKADGQKLFLKDTAISANGEYLVLAKEEPASTSIPFVLNLSEAGVPRIAINPSFVKTKDGGFYLGNCQKYSCLVRKYDSGGTLVKDNITNDIKSTIGISLTENQINAWNGYGTKIYKMMSDKNNNLYLWIKYQNNLSYKDISVLLKYTEDGMVKKVDLAKYSVQDLAIEGDGESFYLIGTNPPGRRVQVKLNFEGTELARLVFPKWSYSIVASDNYLYAYSHDPLTAKGVIYSFNKTTYQLVKQIAIDNKIYPTGGIASDGSFLYAANDDSWLAIDGKFVNGIYPETLVYNPSDGTILKRFPEEKSSRWDVSNYGKTLNRIKRISLWNISQGNVDYLIERLQIENEVAVSPGYKSSGSAELQPIDSGSDDTAWNNVSWKGNLNSGSVEICLKADNNQTTLANKDYFCSKENIATLTSITGRYAAFRIVLGKSADNTPEIQSFQTNYKIKSGLKITSVRTVPYDRFGARVTISGTGFGDEEGLIYIGDQAIEEYNVFHWIDNQIVFNVPFAIKDGTYTVIPKIALNKEVEQEQIALSTESFEQVAQTDIEFASKNPKIESFSVSKTGNDYFLEIKGKNFGTKKGMLYIGLNSVNLRQSNLQLDWKDDRVYLRLPIKDGSDQFKYGKIRLYDSNSIYGISESQINLMAQ